MSSLSEQAIFSYGGWYQWNENPIKSCVKEIKNIIHATNAVLLSITQKQKGFPIQ